VRPEARTHLHDFLLGSSNTLFATFEQDLVRFDLFTLVFALAAGVVITGEVDLDIVLLLKPSHIFATRSN
jgi:hypothetical protein